MKKWMIAAAVVVLLMVLASASFYTVEENQYACIFRFSEIVDVQSEAGAHFKIPFVDTVKYFDKATQFYDIPTSRI